MPPKRTTKKVEPAQDAEIHAEWVVIYGIKVKEWPWIAYISGKDEANAITRLAGAMADEGKRQNRKFRATFLNEPFEID